MNPKHAPAAKAGMLIRRPVAEVFEAFVEPSITTKFWFTGSSGRLEAGKHVRWEWEMYGVSTSVEVKAIEKDTRIVIEWEGAHGPTSVTFTFTSLTDDTTFVGIVNDGFGGSGDEAVAEAIDSAGGFALVLAGLKALLEHGVRLNLVPDRFPKGCEAL